ncbi:MAG: DNA alkylation repair protein [Thermonemataceae bacterium]
MENITQRTGARKIEDIPKEVLHLLNKGEIATVNLVEWLALDQSQLVENTFPALGLEALVATLKAALQAQQKPTALRSIKLVGEALFPYCQAEGITQQVFEAMLAHPSDTVRCYACYLKALDPILSLEEKLTQSLPLVADEHFGVREVVWLALRPAIAENLAAAITLLSTWTHNQDENIRRFTTEATRPRGVWCKHIDALKENPALALPILEPLKADTSKYVQDSVGNWLNDASKTQPNFVQELCAAWEKNAPTKATQRIIKKAKRTLAKQ